MEIPQRLLWNSGKFLEYFEKKIRKILEFLFLHLGKLWENVGILYEIPEENLKIGILIGNLEKPWKKWRKYVGIWKNNYFFLLHGN